MTKQRYGDCPECGKGIKYMGAQACSPKCDFDRMRKAREANPEATQEVTPEDEPESEPEEDDYFSWLQDG